MCTCPPRGISPAVGLLPDGLVGLGRIPRQLAAHAAGHLFVLMALVDRDNVTGGESTVYSVEKQPLTSFTLTEPRELVFVNDERVFHGVSPVLQDDSSCPVHRDVLVITYRHRA
ncbi:2OG-Fe dioxygenase family protein [Streptomyces sp. NPDC019937]|uniref:2OG-Fe dioxygenase family protein n=1 Tax=Streptomyces sp. NPDC019937 TaxID=3154787 RepID=UPI0033D7E9BC